jgi:HD-like signal output (HDOD) protein
MDRVEKLNKTQDLLYDPRITVKDLSKVIAKDRVLSERLIKLIKSYGFPPQAWNVTSAIILLGFGAIRTIISEQLQS